MPFWWCFLFFGCSHICGCITALLGIGALLSVHMDTKFIIKACVNSFGAVAEQGAGMTLETEAICLTL